MTDVTDPGRAPGRAVAASPPQGGPASARIETALAGHDLFDLWRRGAVDRAAYVAGLDAVLATPTPVPLTENQRALSARMHWRPDEVVADALATCLAARITPSADYDVAAYRAFAAEVERQWDHGGRTTFIFPEEAQLLFALAAVTRPRRVAVLGSYYAYWAVWALAGAGDSLEQAVLLDVDPEVNRLAVANLRKLGLETRTDVVTGDAVEYMQRTSRHFDLFVLDAEGPPDAAPRLRGKAVYGPIIEAALPRLRPGGHLAVHNVLLDAMAPHRYFVELVEANRRELAEFLARTSTECRGVEIATTEGVGIYVKERA
ncbi:MAG: class I SAM-dependent methyltransferase [Actinobacteria bacterium]|nr:class I SAM-dependent methyltransferase [Actinomycetota bacterium]